MAPILLHDILRSITNFMALGRVRNQESISPVCTKTPEPGPLELWLATRRKEQEIVQLANDLAAGAMPLRMWIQSLNPDQLLIATGSY